MQCGEHASKRNALGYCSEHCSFMALGSGWTAVLEREQRFQNGSLATPDGSKLCRACGNQFRWDLPNDPGYCSEGCSKKGLGVAGRPKEIDLGCCIIIGLTVLGVVTRCAQLVSPP